MQLEFPSLFTLVASLTTLLSSAAFLWSFFRIGRLKLQLAIEAERTQMLQDQLQQVHLDDSDRSKERQLLRDKLMQQTVRLDAQNSQNSELKSQLMELQDQHKEVQEELSGKLQSLADLKARQQEITAHHQQQIQLLQNSEQRLTESFQNLANKIFDEKGKQFKEQNQESLDTMLNPLKAQLGEFRKKVEDVYEKDTDDRRSLRHEIVSLKTLNDRLGKDAQNLALALKGDNKAQGNWGEMVLEKILEASGLRKGIEYQVQVSRTNHDGKRYQPDVIVRLPEKKDIIVDSKVSLMAYEQFYNNEDERQRTDALKAHVHSIRQHMMGLSGKDYEQLEGVRSLDFVLMFIPIESAFLAAIESDTSLFTEAFNKNIILVSPSTLLATLRTVQSIWRYENQNQNSEEIAASAGAIYDQVALVLKSVEELGRHLNKGQDAYQDLIKRIQLGRGNLLARIDKLQKLGARTKKSIPDQFKLDSVDNESP